MASSSLPPTFNVKKELEMVTEFWSPRVVAKVNDQYIKVAKLKGEFVWHTHENEDECFHIISGSLLMLYEGGLEVRLQEGDVHVVPAGKRHNPLADQGECHVMLVETVTTAHTGDVQTDRTRTVEEQLAR